MHFGRAALILALLPTALLFIGLFLSFRPWFRFRRGYRFISESHDWIFHVFITGFIIFIILFTALGRNYSFMKIIYIFPGLLAILIPLMHGINWLHKWLKKSRLRSIFWHIWLILLLIAYIIPVADLAIRLVK